MRVRLAGGRHIDIKHIMMQQNNKNKLTNITLE